MTARTIYMNVPAVRPEKEESFEERRIIDYLHAYSTTGRPPIPCPQQPTDPAQRAALGYPPLFEPYSESEGGAVAAVNGIATTSSAAPAVANLAAQAFRSTETTEFGTKASYQSLVAQPEYACYSPEECRVEAYRSGKKFAADVPSAPQRPPLLSSVSISASQPTLPQADSLQSVTSMPPYDQHSFEELRLACLKAGRPLTSPEIISQNAVLRLTV
ncbi:hypothetical protein BD309DRAFT_948030 [Dichomitus squalens]|uniref:Uncharacterized protein n=1 Tax=Dichomitus squalens TaxID=114155 RepID=A0A4Q9P4B5_9APHY|nr:hypothetical protein BD309DRAFT_948030 [Dichomitus squalens]TBU53126.1 hypothetical protein BD310DRAFT_1042622 [Dichomitus squalens]